MKCVRISVLLTLFVCTTSALAEDTESARRDAAIIESCLSEEDHGTPNACEALSLRLCESSDMIACLRRANAAWAFVLTKHWPFRCGTCRGGFSLSAEMRLKSAKSRQDCRSGPAGELLCLMVETAHQARHVWRKRQ